MRQVLLFAAGLAVITSAGCRSTAWPESTVAVPSSPEVAAASGKQQDQTSGKGSDALRRLTAEQAPQKIRLVSHAQPVEEALAPGELTGPYDLDTLVQLAVRNNPQIAAARARASALLQRVPQVETLPDPMLTTTVFLDAIQTAAGPQDVALSISQKFPWLDKLALQGDMACHEAQAALAELADVELEIIQQVKIAYHELLYLEEAIQVQKSLEEWLQLVIETTRTKFETTAPGAGLESVLQAETALAQLQIVLVELQQQRAAAAAQLAEALNISPAVVPAVVAEEHPSQLRATLQEYLVMLEPLHPRLQAQAHAVARERSAIEYAERGYYPDVTLGYNWYAIGESGLSPVANGDDAHALMIGMNLPVYHRRNDAAVAEARYRYTQQARQYRAVVNELRASVAQLYAEAGQQQQALRILDQEVLPKAEQTLELSLEAYAQDRIGFQQLIDNYENLLEVQLSFYRRRANLHQTLARLERVVGAALAQQFPRPAEETPAAAPLPADQ